MVMNGAQRWVAGEREHEVAGGEVGQERLHERSKGGAISIGEFDRRGMGTGGPGVRIDACAAAQGWPGNASMKSLAERLARSVYTNAARSGRSAPVNSTGEASARAARRCGSTPALLSRVGSHDLLPKSNSNAQ